MENVGMKIRDYLKRDGRTQVWLSERSGIPMHRLNMSLCGRRRISLDEYAQICGALGVSTSHFLKPVKSAKSI